MAWPPSSGVIVELAALVFGMVVVGGATRLTGSGLSITEWRPVTGAIPPVCFLLYSQWAMYGNPFYPFRITAAGHVILPGPHVADNALHGVRELIGCLLRLL